MAGRRLTPDEVLQLVPQREPFRFIDEILELDEQHIVGRYTFREDAWFYKGHFPGKPITPGVILLETMGQTGVVALAIFLKALEIPAEDAPNWVTYFTDAQVDFMRPVLPGEVVTSRATRLFFRRNKLRSKIEMTAADGTLVAHCEASGMGVRHG